MLDEGRSKKLGVVLDYTLFLAFKANVSKWEPIFFLFLVVATFFVVGYMITTLLLERSMFTRPKN